MKTRTLLLLSVACGFLILLAGGVNLLQVAPEEPEVEVLVLGDEATIGDMTVSVMSIDATGPVSVEVSMAGVPGESALDGWRLLGDGKVTEALTTVVDETGTNVCSRETEVPDSEPLRCTVRFAAVESVQAVAYVRAGEQRQWAP
ncbi:MAG: hypothetical protein ACKOD2_15455 [Ilumatobacteraceae bacterium]